MEEGLINPVETEMFTRQEIIRWLKVKRKAANYLSGGSAKSLSTFDFLITELEENNFS